MKRLAGCVLAIMFLAACATGPKVDWDARVGSFTFDQAVLEMGPPDKDATLTDGMRVSEWLTFRSRNTGGWISYSRSGGMHMAGSSTPDYFLRLTFDKNGKLQGWKKYAK